MVKLLDGISVVIPAYNCEQTINDVIAAIKNQTFSPVEIIVIDDGSLDSTAKRIKNYPDVKYFFQENAGPAVARNHGLKQAQYDVVFFTDSDCVARKDWIEKAVKHFKDEKIAAVCGGYGIANAESLLARCVFSEISYRHENLVSEFPKVFGSYNVGIRKDVFERAGGFNEEYRRASGEDNDLSYKIIQSGGSIYFEKKAIVDHYHPEVLSKYLKEQFRHGFWRAKMYKAHPKMMRGDEYTFWKDVVEVPLACLLIVLFPLAFFVEGVMVAAGLVLMGFVFIEIVYGVLMKKSFFSGMYLAIVMFMRAFARTFGFLVGVFNFILKLK